MTYDSLKSKGYMHLLSRENIFEEDNSQCRPQSSESIMEIGFRKCFKEKLAASSIVQIRQSGHNIIES